MVELVVDWKSDETVQRYVHSRFGPCVAWKSENSFYLDKLGNLLTTARATCYLVTRSAHEIGTFKWTLSYSTYEAHRIVSGRSSPVRVHHACSMESFKEECERQEIADVEEIANDIWFDTVMKEWIQVDWRNRLSVDNNLIEGVYRGTIGGTAAAVKISPQDHYFKSPCLELWKSNLCQYVLSFRGAQIVDRRYHLAFECCQSSLYALVIKEQRLKESSDIFRTLVEGLKSLHNHGISHTKLNPWNVLVAFDGTARITGFKNFTSDPEGKLIEEDLRDLGRMIAFCHHPMKYQINHEGLYGHDIMKGKKVRQSMHDWAGAAADVTSLLLDQGKTLDHVRGHPWLWGQEFRKSFIIEAYEYLDGLSKEDRATMDTTMVKDKRKYYIGNDWKSKIPATVVTNTRFSYKGTSPLELLKFMRNTLVHHGSIAKKVRLDNPPQDTLEFIGTNPLGLELSYQKKFPMFITSVHKCLRDTIPENELQQGPLCRFYL